MKIYTKTGDDGTTSLYTGKRVSKSHIRIESYGTVDELNSYLGLIRDQAIPQELRIVLEKIQNELFVVGSELATDLESATEAQKKRLKVQRITEADIEFIETQIDMMNDSIPAMTHFVLPGGHQTVSFCHIARCVCRRAERQVIHLSSQEAIENNVIKYLNRLSDYLFVLARKLTYTLNAEEIKWVPRQ